MTVSTFFAGTGDGYAEGQNSTYATARGAAATANSVGATAFIGQQFVSPTYFLDECFEMWDTSAIPDTDTVSSAVISLWGSADHSTTDFTINARLDAWSGTAVTGDYIAGASLPGSFTLLATFATSGWTTGAYNDFTDVALPANVNKTGNTGVVFISSRFESNTAPSGDEYVDIATADTAGTTNDPKLVVTHASGGAVTVDGSSPAASVSKADVLLSAVVDSTAPAASTSSAEPLLSAVVTGSGPTAAASSAEALLSAVVDGSAPSASASSATAIVGGTVVIDGSSPSAATSSALPLLSALIAGTAPSASTSEATATLTRPAGSFVDFITPRLGRRRAFATRSHGLRRNAPRVVAPPPPHSPSAVTVEGSSASSSSSRGDAPVLSLVIAGKSVTAATSKAAPVLSLVVAGKSVTSGVTSGTASIAGSCTAPTPVQTAPAVLHGGPSAPTTLDITFDSNVTTGNSIIVAVASDESAVSSVTGFSATFTADGNTGASTGNLSIWYASVVTGGSRTATVNFVGATTNMELHAWEVPGPITSAAVYAVVDNSSNHTNIIGPTETVDNCAFYAVMAAMSAPISTGPTNSFSGALVHNPGGDAYYGGAYLAASDHAAHSTAYTIASGNVGGAVAMSGFIADGSLAASGGGGSDAIPILLWIGGDRLDTNGDMEHLVDGAGYTTKEQIAAACHGVAISSGDRWKDGPFNPPARTAADLVVMRNTFQVVSFGSYMAAGGPPTGATASTWLTWATAIANMVVAAGLTITNWDLEPYDLSGGDRDAAWSDPTDTAESSAMIALGEDVANMYISKGITTLIIYPSSNASYPGSYNDEIQAGRYYGENRFQSLLRGLDNVALVNANFQVVLLGAWAHFGIQNSNVSTGWPGAVQRHIALINDTAATTFFSDWEEYDSIDGNIMTWPDNSEGHGDFTTSEVQQQIEAMRNFGTGAGVVYQHSLVSAGEANKETEWEAWLDAIAAGIAATS